MAAKGNNNKKPSNKSGLSFSMVCEGAEKFRELALGNPPYVAPDEYKSYARITDRLRVDFPETYAQYNRNSMKGVIGRVMAQLMPQLRANNPKGVVRDTGKTYICYINFVCSHFTHLVTFFLRQPLPKLKIRSLL